MVIMHTLSEALRNANSFATVPKVAFFTFAAISDRKPQRNSVIWGIGGDYPPTSKNANVYTFALLAGNEWIYCAFYC